MTATRTTAATRRPSAGNRHRRRRRRALALAALCGAASLTAVATPAQADSIVFVRDANIWLANPDGSGLYQVTTDGTADNAYQSPSQADDGTIVTVRAKPSRGPILRLRQNGTVINEIPVGMMQAGPFEPAISPDGRLVAYEHAFTNSFETSNDIRFSNADGYTDWLVYGHPGSGAGSPSWVDSGHVFLGDYTAALTMAPGQAPVPWWSDNDHEPQLGYPEDLDDGEVAANGTIAFVRGDRDGNTIQLYRSNGPAALPTPTCVLSGPSSGPLGARFSDPTFAPGGGAIAWQEGDGIWTAALPAGDCARAVPRLTFPGASEPDWGPAAINPGPRPVTPPVTPGPVPRTDPPVVQRDVTPRLTPRDVVPRSTRARARARAACAGLRGKRRAACVRKARRATAIKACARKPLKQRKQCVAKAKRRFPA